MIHAPSLKKSKLQEEDLEHGHAPESIGEAPESDEEEAIANLRVAVIYIGPDGTTKQCGNRCSMHIESGEMKNRCTIHSPDIAVPNEASCGWYKKGPAATGHMAMPMKPYVTPKQSGLVLGKVQCKRCVRADEDADMCVALTNVLRKVLGFPKAVFRIEPEGCCNWNRGPRQREPENA